MPNKETPATYTSSAEARLKPSTHSSFLSFDVRYNQEKSGYGAHLPLNRAFSSASTSTSALKLISSHHTSLRMPKVPATSPPRLARKQFSPISTTVEQDADILLRYKHTSHYRVFPAAFDAALALCQLQAKLDSDMNGEDILQRPSKRRRLSHISPSSLIISNITPSSPPTSASASSSLTPGAACGAGRPSRSRAGPRRHRTSIPAYASDVTFTASRLSEETPVAIGHQCPTIKISIESLERLRKSLHEKSVVYRMIDPNYASKKRKRD